MISEAQYLVLLELLDRLLKSWWTVVAGVCVGASAAVVALHFTIPVYEAQATIEADVERLPSAFVRRTISDDAEIQLNDLRIAVLSDKNLKTVIATVFGSPSSETQYQELIDRIRSSVRLRFSSIEQEITVAYQDKIPAVAAQTANLLVEFFVVENQGIRADSARQVRESLESLAMEVSSELKVKKQELNKLHTDHSYELDNQRLNNEQAIAELRKDLDANEQAIRAAKRKMSVLESQQSRALDGATGDPRPAGEESTSGTSDSRTLEIEQELEELLTKLTENHPDVLAKRRELERRRAAIEAGRGTDEALQQTAEESESGDPLPTLDIWNTRLMASRLEVERLEDRSQEIRRGIGRYQAYLTNTPTNQQRVDELTSRVAILEQLYFEHQKKIETAKAGQQLEEVDLANPFMVSGYAAPPSEPIWPTRSVFLLVGIGLGLLVFAGPVLAHPFLKPRILSEASLTLLAKVPVLVVIPTIPTPAAAQLRRRATWRNLGLSALAVSIFAGVSALQLMNWI